jgi:hypothetical protein
MKISMGVVQKISKQISYSVHSLLKILLLRDNYKEYGIDREAELNIA